MVAPDRFDRLSSFEVRTWPQPGELGRALEQNIPVPGCFLQLRFDGQAAGFAVADPWSLCCELLLQAQLVRERRLDHFVLDLEQIFELSYLGGLALCVFSREHVFAVSSDAFAESIEHLVEEILAGTTCPRVMQIAARWSASTIRAQPYSHKFSDSLLT